jgi:hypothetical protein
MALPQNLDLEKTPAEVEDFTNRWDDLLASDDPDSGDPADTIATSVWATTLLSGPVGALSEPQASSIIGTAWTRVWYTGGVDGQSWALTNTITTVGGRTYARTRYLRIVATRSS